MNCCIALHCYTSSIEGFWGRFEMHRLFWKMICKPVLMLEGGWGGGKAEFGIQILFLCLHWMPVSHSLVSPSSQGCRNQCHLHNLYINESLCCILAPPFFYTTIFQITKRSFNDWIVNLQTKYTVLVSGDFVCFDFQFLLWLIESIYVQSLPNIRYSEKPCSRGRKVRTYTVKM